ncbi:4-(cytidine 5'-diphospho)-2-C-methyl-D-erythritol kinase [Lysobacter capsici]|uniref:4-(cytidine 5'-diphospho)-2-C-methyl-D-erythritol kinase n=1 Tax=Lysobacter capsici TaxID=435897 RepID=UPI0006848028|nr:4-(cytidine 5'-diphospho)-2-C-methyl-D-erythritol kinase [Lysobacter capsici]
MAPTSQSDAGANAAPVDDHSDGRAWSLWPAPAKLNLFLRIVGRRADGYHLLQTVFRLLDWGDTIHLRPRDDGRVVRHGTSVAGVAEHDDLTVRAALLLQKEANSAQGADILIEKRIPAGGGFGGGSSDAATVLVALDALWGTDLGVDRLAELGLRLGADVPVFVRGENAWAEGVGESLRPIELAPAWYVLVDPGVHAPTAALFQSSELTRDAAPATISDFVSGKPLGNAFEPVLRKRETAVEAAFAALSRIGSPRLTGSGSGCFVEFATRETAEAALLELPSGLRAWTAGGAGRSPLHAALETRFPQGRRQEAQGTRF